MFFNYESVRLQSPGLQSGVVRVCAVEAFSERLSKLRWSCGSVLMPLGICHEHGNLAAMAMIWELCFLLHEVKI